MKKENTGSVKDSASYKSILGTYSSKKDIQQAPWRTLMYSYCKNTQHPLIFRHYNHMLDDPRNFKVPQKIFEDCCTVFVFVRHNIHLVINDEAFIPNTGDIVIIRKNSVFQPIFFSIERFNYYEINIPYKYFEMTDPSSPIHSIIFGKENRKNIVLSPSTESMNKIFHILKKADNIIEQNHKHKDFLVYSYILRLFSFIDTNVVPEVEHTKKTKASTTIKKAVEYISEKFLSISEIEEVAAHCHISVSYLCRIFKKQLGISPTEFINSRKILHAKHLLKNGASVTDVCFASGFNSYNYFISTFKKLTGQTPGKFSRNIED